MPTPPPGLQIYETRRAEPVRVLYGARQEQLGRSVLLVGLAPGVLPSSPLATMLKREANILAQLDHPNIIVLYDFKCDADELWLVLEDADGFTLSDLRDRQLSWKAVCAIGLDLARALSHAHGASQIHGKLHSAVVTVTRSGRTKLAGFGRAPFAGDDQVEALEPSEVGGLSPEASVGQAIGPLSDVFSLGAILYEMATGTPPFGDPNDTQYPQRVRTMRQTPLLRLKGDFPNSFATLIEQCLQKSPSERPPSADLLASQFAGLIGGATVPLLHDELVRLGLVSGDTGRGERTAEPIRPNTSRGRVRLIALSCGLLALGVATGLLWDRALRVGSRGPTNSGANAPPVAAEQALMLRVVATPWAHVLVDGVQHETTPFARPIALAPGKHVVRLEHPNAAPEERLIEGKAGEIILLNVNLHLERPPLSPPELSAPEEESTP